MKKQIVIFLSLVAAVSCSSGVRQDFQVDGPKISIFSDHISAIARQEGITFAQAAQKVKEIGFNGVDVRVLQKPSQLKTLDSLGFMYSCAITDIDYSRGGQAELEKKTEAFMKKYRVKQVLLVPGLIPEEAVDEADRADARSRIVGFADRMAAKGYEVILEDYDNPRSLCYNTAKLNTLFGMTDNLGMAFDTGNFLFAGEDAYRASLHFADKVKHVHLKDRAGAKDMKCVPAGTGCIPVEAVVRKLVSVGYDGWFTAEQFGSKQMLEDVKTAYANISKMLEPTKIGPKITEYYAPEVPVVDASAFVPEAGVPEKAVALFNGKDLSKWQTDNDSGSPAGWTVNRDGSMTVNKKAGSIRTKDQFGSYHLHVEWKVPVGIEGSSQARGNSGVYLNGLYEVQVLDSYQNPTYVDGMAASIYKQSIPSANPTNAPGLWNTYDIDFQAPVLDAEGKLVSRPRVTVVFNGVKVQDNAEIYGTTEYIGFPQEKWAVRGPISLQSHGDPSKPISFRNIWILEK